MNSTNKSQPDLSILIVSYNTRDLLKDCLESIFTRTQDLSYEIIVVDNNSRDGSVRMLEKLFEEVAVIANRENLGFAKANNQAITRSKGRYVLLLNPDTLIQPNSLTKLVAFMDTHPEADGAGCKLLNRDGSTQHSIGNFPTITNQIAQSLFFHHLFPQVDFFGEINYSEDSYTKIRPVDWVFGAAFIVRREVIEKIGLLDEDFFLFSEEKDWCYRISRAQGKVYYYPGAQIIHYGRSLKPEIQVQLLMSKLQFFRKHNSSLKYFIFELVTLLSVLLRTVVWAAASILNIRHKITARKKFDLYRKTLFGMLNNRNNFRPLLNGPGSNRSN